MLGSEEVSAFRPTPFRLFISSPSDVKAERDACHVVVQRLAETGLGRHFEFQSFAYDKLGIDIPFRYDETPQLSVDRVRKPSACDLVVVILWGKLGTPLPGIHVKPDGSPYRSGTEYELEDALRARKAGGRPAILLYRRSDLPLLPPVTDEDHESKRQQQLAITGFFTEIVEPKTGALLHGINVFGEPPDFEIKFREHLQRIVEERLEATPPRVDQDQSVGRSERLRFTRPPFPGLRTFYREDELIFFGRGRETDQVIRAFHEPGRRFLAVVGASGSGKSSLLRAGVVPRLRRGVPIETCADDRWLYPEPIKPSDQETAPFLALANVLKPFLRPEKGAGDWAKELRGNPASVSELVEEALAGRPANAELVLVVDQFEELFTVVKDPAVRDAFMALLAEAFACGRLRVLLTLRADFLKPCLEDPRLGPLIRENEYLLGTPDRGALREMIEQPARLVDCRFDPEVVDALLRDVCGASGFPEAGTLPLLAFALERLYDKRDKQANRITLEAYRTLGEHGVRGAIGVRAEHVFTALPVAVQAAFGRVFRELVNVDGETVARKRAPRSCFASDPNAVALVNALEASGVYLLIATDGDELEVVHEALFEYWPELKQWVKDYGGDVALLRRAETVAESWRAEPKNPINQPWPHEAQRLIAEALEHLGRPRDELYEPLRSFLRPEADRLLDEIKRVETPHWRRAEIGDRLARIGDPRPGVLTKGAIPDILWVDVDPGRVVLEEDAGTYDVPSFRIARYAITCAQYRAFADAPDHGDPGWWLGLERPDGSWTPFRPTDNHPVEQISWYEAVAFCRWLTARLEGRLRPGSVIRLPTEWEWQLAATNGDANRDYPWGDWQEGYANTNEALLARSTAVGMYPHGTWPEGPLDMSGNVWEWCLNKSEEPDDTSLEGDASRVLRGGSWSDDQDVARSAFRYRGDPGGRDDFIGFRVLCSSPIVDH